MEEILQHLIYYKLTFSVPERSAGTAKSFGWDSGDVPKQVCASEL